MTNIKSSAFLSSSKTKGFLWLLMKVSIGLVTAFFILISYLLYVPEAERNFLESIENEFAVRADKISPYEDEIILNKVTDFSWDRVCWVADDIYLLGTKVDVNTDYLGKRYRESNITHINTSDPKFFTAFVFIFEEKPVKVFQFGRFYTLSVDSRNYSLSYAHRPFVEYKSNFRDGVYLPCFSYERARLKVDFRAGRITLGGI